MKRIIDLLAREGIGKCVAKYGIEGTEDAIKRVYESHPKAKFIMLNILYEQYMNRG